MTHLDATHDPRLQSWVESANDPGCDFPIQNLPLGVFDSRIGVAIGDCILDLRACVDAGVFDALDAAIVESCRKPRLNEMMSLGRESSAALRRAVSGLLKVGAEPRRDLLVPMRDAAMQLPAEIGDYSDFYASIHHATNVGGMFRPDNPLLPNYKYVPIGYHGRASSVVPSGTPVRRPRGQIRPDPQSAPYYAATRLLDYELEVGFYVGVGNELGKPIGIREARGHLFGACLVNDWSARDIQSWEYQPLGPFLGKSFATSVSPWVVTMEALAPFRVPAWKRPEGDPLPLSYLLDGEDQETGGLAITLEVWLAAGGAREVRLSRTTFENMYWTAAQMVTHHSSNGCNLRPGDLIASGTVSGPDETERGCLLELTWRGSKPLQLPGGESRTFLADGDEVILRGYCEREGCARIGFGECRGRVLPG
jgi:fumarylacetoacetase